MAEHSTLSGEPRLESLACLHHGNNLPVKALRHPHDIPRHEQSRHHLFDHLNRICRETVGPTGCLSVQISFLGEQSAYHLIIPFGSRKSIPRPLIAVMKLRILPNLT